eukprot:1194440-Prorocentrum_minimum.AAC.7
MFASDQSDAGSAGICSRRTNQTQEARACSRVGPIRRRKCGYVLTMDQSEEPGRQGHECEKDKDRRNGRGDRDSSRVEETTREAKQEACRRYKTARQTDLSLKAVGGGRPLRGPGCLHIHSQKPAVPKGDDEKVNPLLHSPLNPKKGGKGARCPLNQNPLLTPRIPAQQNTNGSGTPVPSKGPRPELPLGPVGFQQDRWFRTVGVAGPPD